MLQMHIKAERGIDTGAGEAHSTHMNTYTDPTNAALTPAEWLDWDAEREEVEYFIEQTESENL